MAGWGRWISIVAPTVSPYATNPTPPARKRRDDVPACWDPYKPCVSALTERGDRVARRGLAAPSYILRDAHGVIIII